MLSNYAELWEMVCDNLSGVSLTTISQVTTWAQATKQTPAFLLLAGLTSDSDIVEWLDKANIMSHRFEPSVSLSSYREYRLATAADRALTAYRTAEILLRHMTSPYKPQYDQEVQADTVRLHHCLQGPARPPTPQQAHSPLYQYKIFDSTDINNIEGAAVFGIRKGYTFPPYWRALCYGDGNSDDDDANADANVANPCDWDDDDDQNGSVIGTDEHDDDADQIGSYNDSGPE